MDGSRDGEAQPLEGTALDQAPGAGPRDYASGSESLGHHCLCMITGCVEFCRTRLGTCATKCAVRKRHSTS